mgnify:CR=1 FL=1
MGKCGMTVKVDLFSISIYTFSFTVRAYTESNFGWRKLGRWRYALDCGCLAFIFERYWWFVRDTEPMNPYKVTVRMEAKGSIPGINEFKYKCNFVRVNEYQHLVFHTTNGKKYTIRDWVSFIVEEWPPLVGPAQGNLARKDMLFGIQKTDGERLNFVVAHRQITANHYEQHNKN